MAKSVVRVFLPEQENTFKTILLLGSDNVNQVIDKVNKKIRREEPDAKSFLGYQISGKGEQAFGPSDKPFEIYTKHNGPKGIKLLFRMKKDFPSASSGGSSRSAASKSPTPKARVEDTGPKDEFDELLAQLQSDISTDTLDAGAGASSGMFPACSSCGEPIVETPLMAFGMPWHPEHLGCVVCSQPFINGRKVIEGEDGNAYCEADFIEKFAVRCDVCRKPVIGECIQALGKSYHPKCFQCVGCKKPIQGAFFEHEGKIHCETHYYKSLGLLCPDCNKPIFGKCVNAKGTRYHPEHFKCSFCKKQLGGNAFYRHNDKVYCKDCSTKLYA